MGCGKSKHAVETVNAVKKSTNFDETRETTTTKSVTDKGESLVIQKEVETRSVVVKDNKEQTETTNIDPNVVSITDNVSPESRENIETAIQVLNENETPQDSNRIDSSINNNENVNPSSTKNTGEVVEEDEKVKDLSPRTLSNTNIHNMIPSPSKTDLGTTYDMNEDEEKEEYNLTTDKETKNDKGSCMDEGESKESKLTKDNKTKTEFMTPTLSEDVVGPFEVVKEDKGDHYSKDGNREREGIDENFGKTINNSLNSTDDNREIEEQKVVSPVVELTKVETNEDINIEVSETELDNAKTLPITGKGKVTITDEVNVK